MRGITPREEQQRGPDREPLVPPYEVRRRLREATLAVGLAAVRRYRARRKLNTARVIRRAPRSAPRGAARLVEAREQLQVRKHLLALESRRILVRVS